MANLKMHAIHSTTMYDKEIGRKIQEASAAISRVILAEGDKRLVQDPVFQKQLIPVEKIDFDELRDAEDDPQLYIRFFAKNHEFKDPTKYVLQLEQHNDQIFKSIQQSRTSKGVPQQKQ